MMGGKCATCLLPVLSYILICNLVTCEYSIQRTDYKTGVVTVCHTISCDPDFYVEVCTENGTADQCEKCPPGTHLPDKTSSLLPTPCVTGTAIIPPPEPLSSLITTIGPTVSSTPQRTGPGRGTVTMVTLTSKVTTPAGTSDSSTVTSDSGTKTDTAIFVGIGVGVGVLILVVAVVVLVVICHRLKRKRSRARHAPIENPIEMEPLNGSIESYNRNHSVENSAEIISNGMPQGIGGSQTTNGIIGTGKGSPPDVATQNGSSSLYEVPLQETYTKTVYTEDSGRKELYTEGAAVGSTIDLSSAPALTIDSLIKDEDYPESIRLNKASLLDPYSITKTIEVQ